MGSNPIARSMIEQSVDCGCGAPATTIVILYGFISELCWQCARLRCDPHSAVIDEDRHVWYPLGHYE